MIFGLIALFGVCFFLFIICLKLDIRVDLLETEVNLLLSDRKEFFETWERMKEEDDLK